MTGYPYVSNHMLKSSFVVATYVVESSLVGYQKCKTQISHTLNHFNTPEGDQHQLFLRCEKF